MEGLGVAVGRLNVEVQYILSNSQLGIERNCSFVAIVCLNIDDMDAPRNSYLPELLVHGCSHAPPAVLFFDRKIIDVQLCPSLLELRKNISSDAADHIRFFECCDGNECTAGQQLAQVSVIRLRCGV